MSAPLVDTVLTKISGSSLEDGRISTVVLASGGAKIMKKLNQEVKKAKSKKTYFRLIDFSLFRRDEKRTRKVAFKILKVRIVVLQISKHIVIVSF